MGRLDIFVHFDWNEELKGYYARKSLSDSDFPLPHDFAAIKHAIHTQSHCRCLNPTNRSRKAGPYSHSPRRYPQ